MKTLVAFLGPALIGMGASALSPELDIPGWARVVLIGLAAGVSGMGAKRLNKALDKRKG